MPFVRGVRAAVLVARHPGPFPVRRFWVPRQEETRDHALDGPRVPEVHPAHHAHVHDGGHLRRHRRRLRRPCRRRRRACRRQRGIPARVPYPGGGNGPWHGRRRDQLHRPRQGRGGALAAHRRRHLVHARGGLDPHLGAVFPVRRAAVPGAGRPRRNAFAGGLLPEGHRPRRAVPGAGHGLHAADPQQGHGRLRHVRADLRGFGERGARLPVRHGVGPRNGRRRRSDGGFPSGRLLVRARVLPTSG